MSKNHAASDTASSPVKPQRATTKTKLTPAEMLTEEEVGSLRLAANDHATFEELRGQIRHSREGLQAFDAIEVAAMGDGQYESFTSARNRMALDHTAMLHFLVPRVMKLRDGEAKRKWRSFVTKMKKDIASV